MKRVVVLVVADMTEKQLEDFKIESQFDEVLTIGWLARHATGPDGHFVYLPKVEVILPE